MNCEFCGAPVPKSASYSDTYRELREENGRLYVEADDSQRAMEELQTTNSNLRRELEQEKVSKNAMQQESRTSYAKYNEIYNAYRDSRRSIRHHALWLWIMWGWAIVSSVLLIKDAT